MQSDTCDVHSVNGDGSLQVRQPEQCLDHGRFTCASSTHNTDLELSDENVIGKVSGSIFGSTKSDNGFRYEERHQKYNYAPSDPRYVQ